MKNVLEVIEEYVMDSVMRYLALVFASYYDLKVTGPKLVTGISLINNFLVVG
jgi:hypothetical protein